MLSESTRAYVYRGLTGTVPLLVAYGALSDTVAPLWIAAGGAWLGIGMAVANTSTSGV